MMRVKRRQVRSLSSVPPSAEENALDSHLAGRVAEGHREGPGDPGRKAREVISAARLGKAACALAVFSLVEPRLSGLGPGCAVVCLGVILYSPRAGIRFGLLPALVGLFSGLIAAAGYNLEADTHSYMANVASLLQDFDLDIGNQLTEWGRRAPSRGPAGMSITPHPIGNAFVWAIPVAFAHAYALHVGIYPTNFFSPPYFGAVIATNLAIALSGALALVRLLTREVGVAAAGLAVAASILASPAVYYLAVQPMGAHGLSFGLGCWAVVLVVRAVEADTVPAWRWAGAALGLATLCRFQAVVLFAMVPLLGAWSVKSLVSRMRALSPPALVIVLPQVVVWLKTFGRPFAIPQGSGFMKWGSPHWADTLFSADRGLFNWHPLLLLGLLGLLLPRPRLNRLALCGVVIFAVTVWINGAATDFDGGDAFGGRRYDLVIPFFGIGLARLLDATRPVLVRRPLALPALLFSLVVAWNFSFIAFYRTKNFRVSAPAEELASAQARRLRQVADAAFGWMGPGTRFRIYDAFVGLYTYREYRPGGDFDLATLEPRFMSEGWSDVRWWDGESTFRYLLYPQACIVIPIEEPFDLRGFVRARAPARIPDQRLTLTLNGRTLTEAALPAAWTDVPFEAPSRFWNPGENQFCMRALKKRPGDKGDDLAYAAAVVRVQLP